MENRSNLTFGNANFGGAPLPPLGKNFCHPRGGTRYESQNIKEDSDLKGVVFHVAASISWFHKGPLQFYNDEHDFPKVKVSKPRRPRKRKNETEEEHHRRVLE
jgi:hypothetical protein